MDWVFLDLEQLEARQGLPNAVKVDNLFLFFLNPDLYVVGSSC